MNIKYIKHELSKYGVWLRQNEIDYILEIIDTEKKLSELLDNNVNAMSSDELIDHILVARAINSIE